MTAFQGGGASIPETALVLAAQRPDDPLARLAPEGHKCLLPIQGRAMIERVVAALLATGRVRRVAVSIDRPEVLSEVPGFQALINKGRLLVVASAETPATSVLDAVKQLDGAFPLLITTGDHALLSPGMIRRFCAAAAASEGEVAAGLVARRTLKAAFPQSRRTYLNFRDGGYSGANLFYLRSAAALSAIDFWRRVERERKKPWRIAKAFGPGLLAAYLLRLLTLKGALRRISRQLGCPAAPVVLEEAEAAVDVDKPADLELVEAILSRSGG